MVNNGAPEATMTGAAPEVLFLHVPKRSGYYTPIDEFMYINFIPMGVFGMCDLVNKRGISSKITHLGIEFLLDATFSIAEYIAQHSIKLVAISLHWHQQAYDVIEVAHSIKKASPETVIVLGGFTASRFPGELLSTYSFIDCIIAGDGERGMEQLAALVCRNEGSFGSIANCLHRETGRIVDNGITYLTDMAASDGIDYANLSYLDHYREYRDYFKLPLMWSLHSSLEENRRRQIGGASSTFPLMVGRGCNFDCTFCGGGARAQKKICHREKAVFMPVEKVITTMRRAISFGYESFLVCFDPDPSDSSYFTALFEEVRRSGIACGMGFESWGLPDEAFIDAFAQTFIRKKSYIALSPETASEELRKKNKGYFYTNKELFSVMESTGKHRIPVIVYMTMGLSGEKPRHQRMNRSFARWLRRTYRHLLSVIMVPVQLEPSSPLFEAPERYEVTTFRKKFADFYQSHSHQEKSPFHDLGYLPKQYGDAESDLKAFDVAVNRERCGQYCSIPFKLFGRWYIPGISRLLCKLMHRRWLRKGYGKPPAERKTFR